MHRVRYDAALLVKTSLVEAMLEGEAGAQDQVDEVVLLQKMPGWKYENEWLLIGTRGGGAGQHFRNKRDRVRAQMPKCGTVRPLSRLGEARSGVRVLHK